jgi:tetratricopeptide (TPR) repeat protein
MSPESENPEIGSDGTPKSGDFAKIMKWVGYATAILSLAGTLGGIAKVIWDRVETHRRVIAGRVATHSEVDALLGSVKIESDAKDYGSAWKNIEQARKVDPGSTQLQAAEEDLAMDWIDSMAREEIDNSPEVSQKLEPVLARGVASSKAGTRHADLLAHIGWTYFLREQKYGLNPSGEFAKVVAEDPNNPYAQAMWGWRTLMQGGTVSDAAAHFALALASQRQGDYVRRIQLLAFHECHREGCDEEVVRAANGMRKEKRAMDPELTNDIFDTYDMEIAPRKRLRPSFANAVPSAEHLATFHWLFDGADLDDDKKIERSYYTGLLAEAAGQRDEALAMYQNVLSKADRTSSTLWDPAGAGVKRLSNSK